MDRIEIGPNKTNLDRIGLAKSHTQKRDIKIITGIILFHFQLVGEKMEHAFWS